MSACVSDTSFMGTINIYITHINNIVLIYIQTIFIRKNYTLSVIAFPNLYVYFLMQLFATKQNFVGDQIIFVCVWEVVSQVRTYVGVCYYSPGCNLQRVS